MCVSLNISKFLSSYLTLNLVLQQVRGWERVAPLSCILLPQKKDWKPKNKEPDNPTPSAADPTIRNVDSSGSNAESRCDPRPHNSSKKFMPSSQQMGTCTPTAAAALQPDAPERPVLSAMQKTMSHFLLDEKIEEEGALRETPLQPHHLSLKYTASDNRPTKPQKHNHRPNNTVVPIKNFTFLPPIITTHLNPQRVSGQLCSGKKAPEGETLEENCYMFDKKSGTRGSRVDYNPELPNYTASLTSKHRTCQHNHYFLSAGSVSIPKRYQVPVSSKPDTVHHNSYSVGRSLTQALHSSTAAGAQAHIQPNCLFS